MKYLLNTDICIYLIKKKPPQVLQKLTSLPTTDIAISVVTLFELKFGIEHSHQPKKAEQALNYFVQSIPYILPMDEVAAAHSAKVRADLKAKGTPIGTYDTLIAGIAMANNMILVSNNTREFARVEGLKLDNWAG